MPKAAINDSIECKVCTKPGQTRQYPAQHRAHTEDRAEADGSDDKDEVVSDRTLMQDMCRMLEMESISSLASPGNELVQLLHQFCAELDLRSVTMDALVTRQWCVSGWQ
jgi:hypothetical protein